MVQAQAAVEATEPHPHAPLRAGRVQPQPPPLGGRLNTSVPRRPGATRQIRGGGRSSPGFARPTYSVGAERMLPGVFHPFRAGRVQPGRSGAGGSSPGFARPTCSVGAERMLPGVFHPFRVGRVQPGRSGAGGALRRASPGLRVRKKGALRWERPVGGVVGIVVLFCYGRCNQTSLALVLLSVPSN
jgi:hypothetical protein